MNWQVIIAILLLAAAVYYIVRTLRRSFGGQHDCPDCSVSQINQKKVKSLPKHLQQK